MMATQQIDTAKNDGSDLQNTPIVSSFVGGSRYWEQYEQDNSTISNQPFFWLMGLCKSCNVPSFQEVFALIISVYQME
jgi:hypothetical protein